MKNIRAIIFDFGGVISSNDDLTDIGRYLAKKYLIPKKTLDAITRCGWMKARINPAHDARFWQEVARALGISKKKLHAEYLAFPLLSRDVIQIVRLLRKRYIVGMLSNQIQSWHQILMKQWKLQKLFDPIVTSYTEKVAKPDPKIYKRMQQRLKVPFNECVYIDDRKYNLVPAKKLGMQTILFKIFHSNRKIVVNAN